MNKFASFIIIIVILGIFNLYGFIDFKKMKNSLEQFKQVLIYVEPNQQVLKYAFILCLFGIALVSFMVYRIVGSMKKREMNFLKNQIGQLSQPIKNSNIGNNSNSIDPSCKVNDIELVNKFHQDIGSGMLILPKINMDKMVFGNCNVNIEGSIKKAKCMGKNVAIKVGKNFDPVTQNEIKSHMLLAGHKNIVDIYGYIEPPMATAPSYIIELMDISLIDYLLKFKSYLMGQHQAMYRIIYEVIDGVSYMHHNGFVHGDLHPGNILLKNIVRNSSDALEVKLSHFKLCKYLANDPLSDESSIGCKLFMSPESKAGLRRFYDKGDDVYSVAVVVWLIFTFLFYGDEVNYHLNEFLLKGVSALDYQVLPLHLAGIIRKCMGPRCYRPSIQELGFEVSIAEAKDAHYESIQATYNTAKLN